MANDVATEPLLMWHDSLARMRDRRNTSLSISSNTSSSSTSSAPTRCSPIEKRHSSPPPFSDALPPPVTKENRPRAQWRRTIVVKIIAAVLGVFALLHLILAHRFAWPSRPTFSDALIDVDVEPAPDDRESREPTSLMIADHARWTVSIPHNASFPLPARSYQDICRQGDRLREEIIADSHPAISGSFWRKQAIYATDRTFMDIDVADKAGKLPRSHEEPVQAICDTSLTFVLESDDAGLGKSLLLLWLSYGLAKEEGRAFFLDDSRWAWGEFATYFIPPTAPSCSRPPVHHIVPCPHNAKHLVVSSATASRTFGEDFYREYYNGRRHGVARQSRIFDLVRIGYEALHRLTDEDSAYAASRTSTLRTEAATHDSAVIGMQVRRGDLHPVEFQYSLDYLPLERYAEAAHGLLRSVLFPDGAIDDLQSVLERSKAPLVLASDDPDVLHANELVQAAAPFAMQRAQERIQLATKTTLDLAAPVQDVREPGSAYVKHVDENSGWEGGFYSALFFSLGRSNAATESAGSQHGERISNETLQMRQLIGRAYLLDLAVLGESDGLVCAVSSAACRILAVAMGWDAVVNGRWVNVDDGRAWSWDGNGR